MAIDISRLPPTLPVTVKRVEANGLPSKVQVDWEQYTRDWFKRTTVDMDTRLTEVTSTAADNSARITNEATARAGADGALALQINTVGAQTSANAAAITTETLARTTADTALAQQTTTLSTTVGQHTSTLQVQAQSINGMEVRYGVLGTVNGVTGGFIFSGVQKNNEAPFFQTEFLSNVVINGDLTLTGTLTTRTAAPNAWTDAGVVYATGGGVSTTVFLRSGAKVLIRAVAYAASGYIDITTLAPPNFIRLFVNGTTFAAQAAGVTQYEHWTGAANQTFWKLVPTPIEYVYVVPADGFYTLVSNFDTGAGASWLLAYGEQAK